MASPSLILLFVSLVSSQYVPQPFSYKQPSPPVTIAINTAARHQTMMGGGCSGAFGVACDQTGGHGLSPSNQALVSTYLFNENVGGLSILRNRIGSSPTDGLLPTCPSSTHASPNYTSFPDNAGADSCQLELARQALAANPDLFVYADAWSAPGCFKTDGTDINGGLICGVRGSNCSADWREAYAEYLVQYVREYEARGIKIGMLGAYNEPDFNPVTYASMQSDGYQVKDFLEVLYPVVKKYRSDLKVACCDATGARQERDILYELQQAGGGGMYDVATWHNYQSNPEGPFNTQGKMNLQTEWADGGGSWNDTWDVTGQLAEGFQWALYMHDAFVNSDTSGYLHWWCSQNSEGGPDSDGVLIKLLGDSFLVSRRLWAFAGFFRFARPGSVRVDAVSSAENVYASAYENTNGTIAVPVINERHFEQDVEVSLRGVKLRKGLVSAYVADNERNNTLVKQWKIGSSGWGRGSIFSASLLPRSMTTFFLE